MFILIEELCWKYFAATRCHQCRYRNEIKTYKTTYLQCHDWKQRNRHAFHASFPVFYLNTILWSRNAIKIVLKTEKSSIPWDSLQGLSETSPKWRMAAIYNQRTASSTLPVFLSEINQLKVPQWSSVWQWRGIYHSQIKARSSSTFAFTLGREFMRTGGIVCVRPT